MRYLADLIAAYATAQVLAKSQRIVRSLVAKAHELPVGTIREWKSGRFKKVGPGNWVKISEESGVSGFNLHYHETNEAAVKTLVQFKYGPQGFKLLAEVMGAGEKDDLHVSVDPKHPDRLFLSVKKIDKSLSMLAHINTKRNLMVLQDLRVDESSRGTAAGVKAMDEMFDKAFKKLKVFRINVQTKRSDNSYYIAPRLGAYKVVGVNEFDEAGRQAYLAFAQKNNFPIDRFRIEDLMKSKEGRDLWRKHGFGMFVSWAGNPNSESRKRLKAYIAARKSGGAPVGEKPSAGANVGTTPKAKAPKSGKKKKKFKLPDPPKKNYQNLDIQVGGVLPLTEEQKVKWVQDKLKEMNFPYDAKEVLHLCGAQKESDYVIIKPQTYGNGMYLSFKVERRHPTDTNKLDYWWNSTLTLAPGHKTLHIDYARVFFRDDGTGKNVNSGIGSEAFTQQYLYAKKLGLDEMNLQAVGNGDGYLRGEDQVRDRQVDQMQASGAAWFGYHAWPSFGFDRHLVHGEVGMMVQKSKNFHYPDPTKKFSEEELTEFQKAKTVQDIFKKPRGAEFWERFGRGGNMRFILTKKGKSASRFEKYLMAKEAKKKSVKTT